MQPVNLCACLRRVLAVTYFSLLSPVFIVSAVQSVSHTKTKSLSLPLSQEKNRQGEKMKLGSCGAVCTA